MKKRVLCSVLLLLVILTICASAYYEEGKVSSSLQQVNYDVLTGYPWTVQSPSGNFQGRFIAYHESPGFLFTPDFSLPSTYEISLTVPFTTLFPYVQPGNTLFYVCDSLMGSKPLHATFADGSGLSSTFTGITVNQNMVNGDVTLWFTSAENGSSFWVWLGYYTGSFSQSAKSDTSLPYKMFNQWSDTVDYYSSGAYDGQYQYQQGYNAGLAVGENTGYQRGYSTGYAEGIAETTDYSFMGLLDAVVSVPINSLTGLLDFSILGTNVLGLLIGIIICGIAIAIIKLVVGALL